MKKSLVIVLLLAGLGSYGDLTAISPTAGSEVVLLPQLQKDVAKGETFTERYNWLAGTKEPKLSDYNILMQRKWRSRRPVVITWITNGNEKGPWQLKIGKNADLSDATAYYLEEKDVTKRRANKAQSWSYAVTNYNFEVNSTYYWQVKSNVRCAGPWPSTSMLTNPDTCRCIPYCEVRESEIVSFRTEDAAPRWIILEGRTRNMRDLGGWRTMDGKRVRQGMVFRGQGLNDNSVTGDEPGANRLTVEDVHYLTQKLGIRTDLDLRTDREIGGLTNSPLAACGATINYIRHSSPAYKEMFTDEGRKITAKNFRVFTNRANYPIYFHCIAGADRTGSLAYILNGVLGVSQHDLEVDWEHTFYPKLPISNDPNHWQLEKHLTDGVGACGEANATWTERCYAYLISCGITKEEIETFRNIMLEN